MNKKDFELLTLLYILQEKIALFIQLYYYYSFFTPHMRWMFILITNLLLINRLITMRVYYKQIPVLCVFTFSEDIYFYCKFLKQKDVAKYALLNEKSVYAYSYLKQSSSISLFYTKLIIYFSQINSKENFTFFALELILLFSLSCNFFIRTLDKYFDFVRIFSQSQCSVSFKKLVSEYLLSTLSYIACISMIRQNLKIDWFIFFYSFLVIQIISSCKYSLDNRLAHFDKNPLIEKFIFHFDIDFSLFKNDRECVGAVTLTKAMRYSVIQKFILLLCFILRLNESKKISAYQLCVLFLTISSIAAQLTRLIMYEIQQKRLSHEVIEIDCISEIQQYNQQQNNQEPNFFQKLQSLQIMYIYLQLQPDNEQEIIQFLFNTLSHVDVVSKDFSRQCTSLEKSLFNIRIDFVHDQAYLKEALQYQKARKNVIIITRQEEKNLVHHEGLFKPLFKAGNRKTFILEMVQGVEGHEDGYQKIYNQCIEEINAYKLQCTVFDQLISPHQTYNPSIILFDLFD